MIRQRLVMAHYTAITLRVVGDVVGGTVLILAPEPISKGGGVLLYGDVVDTLKKAFTGEGYYEGALKYYYGENNPSIQTSLAIKDWSLVPLQAVSLSPASARNASLTEIPGFVRNFVRNNPSCKIEVTVNEVSAPANAAKNAAVSKVLVLDASKYPVSAANLEEAGAVNVPLTVNRTGAVANRAAALQGLEKIPGYQLDEAPPAFLRKLGDPVIVRPTPPADNMGAGASLGNQARPVPNGERVIIIFKKGGGGE
jgi:hypothetical protein